MIKDLKNVIITFGLIALVFAQGSLAYKEKIKKENTIASVKQQENKDTELIKEEKDNLAKILEQQNELKQQAASNTLTQNNDQTQADIKKQQALLLASEKAKAKILAEEKAKAKALQKAQDLAQAQAQVQTVIPKSRQSRAS